MCSYLSGLLPFDKHALSHLMVYLKTGASFAEWIHGAAHVHLQASKIEHVDRGKQKQQEVDYFAKFHNQNI